MITPTQPWPRTPPQVDLQRRVQQLETSIREAEDVLPELDRKCEQRRKVGLVGAGLMATAVLASTVAGLLAPGAVPLGLGIGLGSVLLTGSAGMAYGQISGGNLEHKRFFMRSELSNNRSLLDHLRPLADAARQKQEQEAEEARQEAERAARASRDEVVRMAAQDEPRPEVLQGEGFVEIGGIRLGIRGGA